MKAQGTGGSILTVASVGAHCAVPGKLIAGYCATKGGVLAMTRAMADELIPWNIRVNSISPGFVCLFLFSFFLLHFLHSFW
jgi:sorbose reductase